MSGKEPRKRTFSLRRSLKLVFGFVILAIAGIGAQWFNTHYDIRFAITSKAPQTLPTANSRIVQTPVPSAAQPTYAVPAITTGQRPIEPALIIAPPLRAGKTVAEIHNAFQNIRQKEEQCRQARRYSPDADPSWVKQQLETYCRW
jgi:hypothetical protein